MRLTILLKSYLLKYKNNQTKGKKKFDIPNEDDENQMVNPIDHAKLLIQTLFCTIFLLF